MEIWDLYDRNRNVIGEHIRGEELPENGYHLVVHVWIKNKNGEYLISQRSKDRVSNPLKWECQGGSVLKGEKSIDGAIREVKEEVGIDLFASDGKVLFTHTRDNINGVRFNDIMDVWLFEYNGNVDLTKATTKEVAQVKWLNKNEIQEMCDKKEFVGTLNYFFDKVLDK